MTNAQLTMSEILPRIEHAMHRVVQALTQLTPDAMIEPRLAGGRSVKDVLAHLTWWDQWLLFTLPADPTTSQTPVKPPLFDQIPEGNEWAEEMNAKVFAYNQPRALATIQAEFAATCEQLLQRIAHPSIADLYAPDGMTVRIGQPVAPLILGIYEHYEDHAHELEQLYG
ncbi:MAG: ClbS/DfsB family four-helix bundle protein [Caldilineaceae bacterium]